MDLTNLHDYQRRAVDWMTERDRGFVWLGMGDGKTIIAATAIAQMGHPTLVVGTKRIVEQTWPQEIAKWDHTRSMTYAAATGPRKEREAAVAAKPDILAVSYENLRWLLQTGGTRGRHLVIYDEISKMKSPSAKRFKAMHAAIQSAMVRPKMFGLTATPAREGHGGLWSQWRAIGGDDRLGKNITAFRERFTRPIFRGSFTDYVIPPERAELIEELLSPDVFTIPQSERPYVGDPLFDIVNIPWGTSGARNQYRRMERKLLATLESGTTITAASRGVASNKCRQLATGFIFDEESAAHFTDAEKLDAVAEAVEELQGEPCLVFYQFIPERDELKRRMPQLKTLDESTTGQLLLHPKSAGHGLNLQHARYAFFSSLPWSGEEYGQAIGRIDRQGQTQQPVIKLFLREDSIDHDVLASAEGKLKDEADMIARLRERQSS